MIKKRFPETALRYFGKMERTKLEDEIATSLIRLAEIKPRNHREELSLQGNYHRVKVLETILQYQHQPDLRSKVEIIATLSD
jgi:hypothetical protein